MTLLLQLMLLLLQLGDSILRRVEKKEHEKQVAEIKRDPVGVFMRKFGRVPVDPKPDAPSVSATDSNNDETNARRSADQ